LIPDIIIFWGCYRGVLVFLGGAKAPASATHVWVHVRLVVIYTHFYFIVI